MVRVLTGVAVRDVNCAFKLFRAEVFRSLTLRSTGAMINAEILALATRNGCCVYEVPVSHYPRKHGRQTGGNPTVILNAFRELAIFLWRAPRRTAR